MEWSFSDVWDLVGDTKESCFSSICICFMEWSFSDVWDLVGDAKDGCFSSICMEEFGWWNTFQIFGISLQLVCGQFGGTFEDNETFRSLKVSTNWDLVLVVSYQGFCAMYFHLWFSTICNFFLLELSVIASSTECSSSWTQCAFSFSFSFFQ